MRKIHPVLLVLIALVPACTPLPVPSPTMEITDEMRQACPMLTDEVLDAFIVAISGLRDDGLSESDALVQWVEGCDNIPEDGNFGGDVEACQNCMPAIVIGVYETAPD
jgi:hypothetical protein